MSGARVLLVRVGEPPRPHDLPTDDDGGHLRAMMALLDGPPAVVRLPDGTDLWRNDDAFWLGLPLNRHVPGAAPEVPTGFEEMEPLVLVERLRGPVDWGGWTVHGDFLLARRGPLGGLAGLTDRDVERWTLWLELDALLNRGKA